MTSFANSYVFSTTVLPAPTLDDPTAATLPAYADALRQLMPQGLAWVRATGSTQDQIMLAIAKEFAYVGAQVELLLRESDPSQTVELLGEWEDAAGILPNSLDIPSRQAQLVQRLSGNQSPTLANLAAAALELGYSVTSYVFKTARAGSMVAGDPSMGVPWSFAFAIVYTGALPTATLEALIRRIAQAHTAMIFDYGIFATTAVTSTTMIANPSAL